MREELYAVLVSVAGDTLLLPNAAVAEVISPERMERPAAGAPGWLAGRISHNNRQLPVIRFEVLNGAPPGEDTRRTRAAIVHALSDQVAGGQYAVLCQGHPHLVALNRNAMRGDTLASTDQDEFVLARVGIGNTSALIPNLEAVEARLAQLEGQAR